jgi:hypothetical protein
MISIIDMEYGDTPELRTREISSSGNDGMMMCVECGPLSGDRSREISPGVF